MIYVVMILLQYSTSDLPEYKHEAFEVVRTDEGFGGFENSNSRTRMPR
jgi:hypothetical protein